MQSEQDKQDINLIFAEDDKVAREILGNLIARRFPDLRAYGAKNGREALELFREQGADILITDINMPVMDGLQLVEEVRALSPAAEIILLTACTDTDHLLQAINLGVSHYVLKPLEQERLFDAIRKCRSRIALERQLASQQRFICKLSTAVEQSPSTVIITDVTGRIEYVNPKFTELTGYAPEEVIGRTPRILKSGLVNPELYRELWRIIAEGGEWRGEFVNRKKNGELYWESAAISPVRDSLGCITHYVAVKKDITGQKLAEEKLRQSEMQLAGAQQIAHIGSWDKDFRTGTVVWSDEMYRVLGLRPGEVTPSFEAYMERVHLDDREYVLPTAEEIHVRNQRFDYVHRIIRPDGSLRYLRCQGEMIVDADQKPARIIGTAQDITELKEAQEAVETLNTDLAARAAELEEVNRELEAFNYTASHDLRNPLTNITGSCQVLLELFGSQLDDNCAGFIRTIHEQAMRMNQLIDLLLKFSRIGRQPIRTEEINLSNMALGIVTELHLREPERRVTFNIAEEVKAAGDPGLVRLVLENLIGNAWKYSSKKETSLIEFGTREREGTTAYFVLDNGAGFDMGQADRLFAPFHRLHSSEEFSGHGIGLATVKRIIQRHGGMIWAESAAGKGATFYFTLP